MGGVLNNRSKKVAICTRKLPPCTNICPAGENIQRWIYLAKENKFHEAWEVITQRNPFPAIHGRICYHHCETRCSRTQYDETVGVSCIERFLGDMAIDQNWSAPVAKEKIGKKVLVVGAGPAGLTAAYYLRLMGVDVTIYEALAKPGGMMLVGIPAYRLARDVLSKEIERVLNTGIKIEYSYKVEDIIAEKEKGGFDAVFLAIGAHLGKSLAIKMENPCRILDAVDYLNKVAFDNSPDIGSRIVVYGGGNTAIDVARTAKRFGALDVTIIYHRTREKMPAFSNEFDDAIAEGVRFIFLHSIVGVNGNSLTLSVNELDEKGRPKHTGVTETIEVDTLVFALSQIPDSEFLRKVSEIEVEPHGVVAVDKFFMTGRKGIFAGGDMIPYERSVTFAVGHGRKAANHIAAYLNNTVFNEPPQRELIHFDKLNISDKRSEKTMQEPIDASLRIRSFDEIMPGVDQKEALYEVKRCFSCGNCFGCGKCYEVCPVDAIARSESDGRVTYVDREKCIGCSKCFKVCPCGAITMIDR